MAEEYPSYKKVKEEFEKTHFKVKNPFCYCQYDVEDDIVIFHSKEEMQNLYQNMWYTHEEITEKKGIRTIEKESKPFITQWMKDPKIRTYKKVDFLPCQKDTKETYNLWNGWEASKRPPTKLQFKNSLMYKHMQYIFGEAFEFELDKMAYILQTGKKTDVTTVLSSAQGVGKDTALDYFGNNILGEKYYLNEDYIDMLIGDNFNDVISNKIVIVLNESKKAKTDEIMEAIKNAITREKNCIRAKFLKPRYETNYINFYVPTNNHDSIQVQVGDRRFIAIKVPPTHKGDTTYFNNLYNEIKSKKYDRACYDFLMNRNIKVKNFQNERPITSYYKDLQERNIPITAQFLTQIMMEEEEENFSIQATDFFNQYCEFLKKHGYEYKTNMTKFGLEMKQYSVVVKRNTKKCVLYEINMKQLEKFLIQEKFYVPEKEEACMLALSDKEIKEDKAEYVRAEEYKKLSDKIDQLNTYIADLKEMLHDDQNECNKYIKELEKRVMIYEDKNDQIIAETKSENKFTQTNNQINTNMLDQLINETEKK